MLTKLLKYDLKSLFKTLLPVYLITFMLALLTRGSQALVNLTSIFRLPAGFIVAFYFIVLIALPIVTFILSIMRYYNNLSKDEGYLMHTLPISKSKLVMSKLISALLAMTASCVVLVLALLLGCLGVFFEADVFTIIFDVFKIFDVTFIILMIVSLIVGVIYQQVMFYAAMALGQKHNTKKGVYSIVYGVVLYNAFQIINALFMVALLAMNKNFTEYMNMDVPPMHFMNTILVISLVVSLISTVLCFFLTTKTLEKKLNLE